MFDGIGPKLKNLLPQSNIWIGVNTFKKNAIATTTFEIIKLRNETAATATITVQEAPTLTYKGNVWVSDSSLTKGIEGRTVLTGVSGASYLGNGILRTQLFKEGDGWRTATDLYNRDPSGNNGAKLIIYGAQDLEFAHGNQDPATQRAYSQWVVISNLIDKINEETN